MMAGLLFLPLALAAGGSIDLIQHEAYRSQLQNGLDRGVLAAASLSQTKAAKATVEGYLKTMRLPDGVVLKVDEVTTTNTKKVSAQAQFAFATTFLQLAGISTLPVFAAASAEEKRQNIEMSLMLDMSGSMNDGGKMLKLKPAAKQFVDTMLGKGANAYTSLTVVPYAGGVSLGTGLFDVMQGKRLYTHSSCVLLDDSDYGLGVPKVSLRTQLPQFTEYNYGRDYLGPWWCPKEETSIVPLSNDATTLKQQIENFRMYDGTGTAIAMEWGLTFLNPAARSVVSQAATKGLVPEVFSSRPSDFNSPSTMKIIVLMTDGEISVQRWPNDIYKVPSMGNKANPNDNHNLQTVDQARAKFFVVCNAAKASGVTIFTIGFQVNNQAKADLLSCASSASHAYNVDNLDIATAFQSIATTIQKIKLTN